MLRRRRIDKADCRLQISLERFLLSRAGSQRTRITGASVLGVTKNRLATQMGNCSTRAQSHICKAMTVSIADHCARCRKIFGQGETIFVVRKRIVYQVPIPVCDLCVRARERTTSVHEGMCQGCGRRILSYNQKTVCSERCAQRVRRAWRHRERSLTACTVCKSSFGPARKNAKFCSHACRQHDYRIRHQPVDA
jgi:hypothetical protein